MGQKEIARALRGAVQWLGIGLVAVFVIVLGLLWPEDDEPEFSTAVARADDEAEAAKEDVPEASRPSADHVEIPDEPVEEEKSEDEILDDLEAEGDENAVVEEAEPVQIPPGIIRKVEDEREWVSHTVVPLESVDQIAHRYDVKPEAFRMWNGIRAKTTKLKPGTTVKVKARRIPPQRVRLEYVVKPKDTWWKIGTRYGVDSVDLRAQNREAPRRLKVGQRIEMWIDPVVFEWIAIEDDNDPQTLRPGAVGIGPPHEGRLVNGVQLPRSDYYSLRLPPSSYGTTHAVEQVQRAIVLFQARTEYERPLVFGSMSSKHGGELKGHRSHQTGRDLDIRLPLKTKHPDWFPPEERYVDFEALWHLITAFKDTDQAVVVFFDYDLQKPLDGAAKSLGASKEERRAILQYPQGPKARGFVQHSPGHDRHIHVRFTCGLQEVECTGVGADELGD